MQKKSIDTTLLFLVMGLVIFGMIVISSVSVYPSFKKTTTALTQGYNYYFLVRNITHVIVWVLLMTFFSKFTYSFFEKYSKYILFWVYFSLIAVLLFWKKLNGATGWIDIPWLPSIQPVEFVKIGLLIYLAYFIKRKKSLLSHFQDGFIPYFLIAWWVFLLLALQPDFWSVLIIAPVIIALYFVWGGNIRYLWISFLTCILGVVSVYGIGKMTSGWEKSKLSYISTRIDNFLQDNHTLFTNTDTDGKDYQIKQWLIALGSGGFFGLGFWKSIQKFGYLPEVQWDFVFSVIVQELGSFGWSVLLLVYVFIIYRWYTIARAVKDPFGKYLAFGISTLILVQVFVNVWVNLNVIPLTGVTLPFVSYWGSSLISLMVAVWILLNISRYMEYTPKSQYSLGNKRRISSESI